MGKELVARALHEQSQRKQKAFVKFNCAALPESIIESELCSHERGAFTGAIAMRKGRFELADHGTMFLDEIGDVSPVTRVKLLRVLQEKEFERMGGTNPINVRELENCIERAVLLCHGGSLEATTFRPRCRKKIPPKPDRPARWTLRPRPWNTR